MLLETVLVQEYLCVSVCVFVCEMEKNVQCNQAELINLSTVHKNNNYPKKDGYMHRNVVITPSVLQFPSHCICLSFPSLIPLLRRIHK